MSYIGKQPLVTPSSFTAEANGAISDGDPCVIESAGTVAAVTGASVTEGLGSQTEFATVEPYGITANYDSGQGISVIFYATNSGGVYARTATITGSNNSVSYGTQANHSNSTGNNIVERIAAYDATTGKHVAIYRDSTGSGYAVVASVSGTTVSFGTRVSFDTSSVGSLSITAVGSGKVVISYSDGGNSNRGTSIVGTISGNSISFGSAVVFASETSSRITSCYDSTNDRVFISFNDTNSYGAAIVGTVSGTSISFGTKNVFYASTVQQYKTCYFDESQDVIPLFYLRDNYTDRIKVFDIDPSDNSLTSGANTSIGTSAAVSPSSAYHATAQQGVVSVYSETNQDLRYYTVTTSGTTPTISSVTEWLELGNTGSATSTVYDASAERLLLATNDTTGDTGESKVLALAYSTTNITAENFIGFADAGYADGATATVQLSGAVDDAQSGLTAGQQYFVQTDGSLGTTADDPSVIAGVALSATEIAIDTSRD